MGPERDNVWREQGIVDTFPEAGPPVRWKTPVANGYSGPAVADGRVFLTDYRTADKLDESLPENATGLERVLCLDQNDGRVLWQHAYPVHYDISYPNGPRCTPTVDEDRVYTLGAEGHLHCLATADGRVLWSKNLPKAYGAKTPLWGYAGHPLVDGPRLIVVAGGPGSHAVALDKHSGEEIWRQGTSPEQGYCPPTIIRAAGVRQLILLHAGALESVDPETGQAYWSVPYEADNGSVIMTPVYHEGLLFAGGFSRRNLLVELDQDRPAATVLWRDVRRAALSPVNVQPFVEAGTMYGMSQDGVLYAVDFASGQRLWESTAPLQSERPQKVGTAFMVRHKDHVWMFTEGGELVITRLSPEGYQEIDRTKIIAPTATAYGRRVVWSAPAWAGGCVFVRNDEACVCVDLRRQD